MPQITSRSPLKALLEALQDVADRAIDALSPSPEPRPVPIRIRSREARR